jgi:hypothetical protein
LEVVAMVGLAQAKATPGITLKCLALEPTEALEVLALKMKVVKAICSPPLECKPQATAQSVPVR